MTSSITNGRILGRTTPMMINKKCSISTIIVRPLDKRCNKLAKIERRAFGMKWTFFQEEAFFSLCVQKFDCLVQV